MGLGLLGRGLGDAKFLAECGAKLTITDLKTERQLKSSLRQLKKFKNITYHLGDHRFSDFKNKDFILKAAGVPLNSPFIKEAKKNNIPIQMSTALFVKLSNVEIIGITGTRGKSTTTQIIYEVLKAAGKHAYLGGNVKGVSTLSLLKKIKKDDIVVLELDSWQLQGFGELKISPHIAIFTNLLPDHLNYYKGDMNLYFKDKSNIFKFQNKNDFTIAGSAIAKRIKTKGKKIIPKPIPASIKLNIPGEHNLENAALALETVKILGIKNEIFKKTLSQFNGVPGRLELIRITNGIKFYNDTTATTPKATETGLKALGNKKNIILIMGGADKKIDMGELLKIVSRYTKKVILLPGSGTDKLPKKFTGKCAVVKNLNEAVKSATSSARKGDIVLLSPAFASFGLFKNEFDRGAQFNKLVKKLK